MPKTPSLSISTPNNSIHNDNPTYTYTIRSTLLSSNSSHPLGTLLYIDFIFYDTISIHGYTPVLDVVCASIAYPFAFPTHVKCFLVSIFL